ncbi:hypothetical protein [Nonomuraea dietziae]|uniref:hypothetical protein n=1 Tax=Nonomuraea dietziae TaxID=65515 RepID=UPI0031D1E383
MPLLRGEPRPQHPPVVPVVDRQGASCGTHTFLDPYQAGPLAADVAKRLAAVVAHLHHHLGRGPAQANGHLDRWFEVAQRIGDALLHSPDRRDLGTQAQRPSLTHLRERHRMERARRRGHEVREGIERDRDLSGPGSARGATAAGPRVASIARRP